MKFVLLLALVTSLSVSAQTNTESAPAAAPAQDHMGAPAAGESSMGQETKTKKHGKAHHAKKKHHKKKKHHAAN